MDEPGPLPRRGGFLTLVAVGAIGLAVGGWLLFGGESSPTTTTGASFGIEVGAPAPAFTVRLLDGGTFSLERHLVDDGRPVLLNFWASWCTPCRAEMPALDAASGAHPEVLFVGVATDDTVAGAEDFAGEVGVGYPLGIDTTGVIGADYGAFGLPTTFGIGADGSITAIAYGELEADEIDELLATLGG